ncbi:MAG: helix-turn-helix domain-containing protein [Candidatus Omnitrophica bacterium]|nr:helix-turn-helix domain-containing protein [Candidatus Omnitrophota bacterium]
MIKNEMSDEAILNEIGLRIARCRLNKNVTQSALAIESGVSTPTIQRAEGGASIQLVKLIRILRALNLIENIELLVPELAFSPLQQLKMKGKIRRRASLLHENEKAADWTWGDEG